MKILVFVVALLLLESWPAAFSQEPVASRQNPPQPSEKPCVKDEQSYPSGTVLGDKLCSDGQWITIPPS